MNYWDSVGRWINTLLVFIVGVLAFDALFRLLEANEANVIVSSVRALSVAFLVPFQGMFGEQDFVLTTLIGVLGYSLLAGIALGVLRSLQASRAQPAPPVQQRPPPPAAPRSQAQPASPTAPRSQAPPPASAAQATPRGASRSAAKKPPPPRRDGGDQDRRRTPPPASTTSSPTRERTDGQRRANGRQQRPRPEPETRDGARRGEQPERRTAGRRRTPRGTNGTTRS
ncbi:MAG: hypothetical protein KY460_05295 [Actinobacteria bacterium]|nr:hypothetical protein [Actinomycetota bacterium]